MKSPEYCGTSRFRTGFFDLGYLFMILYVRIPWLHEIIRFWFQRCFQKQLILSRATNIIGGVFFGWIQAIVVTA